MTNTLTGAVLAAAAGLNAYVPLLVLALADRVTTRIDLPAPYNVITSGAGIAVILLLLTLDLVFDKIPNFDHMNDLVHTAVRPAAGMFLMMAAVDGGGEIDIIVAMFLGLLIAGGVHTYKSLRRIRIAKNSSGFGSPLVSMVEDGLAGIASILAIAYPLLGIFFVGGAGFALAWVYRVVPNSFGPQDRKPGSEAIVSKESSSHPAPKQSLGE
ncbi:DUF4126 domain-containing protein [soil metagenome]